MKPRRVGPYEIERDLGRGAQGAVFQALDTRSGERVALKVLASPSDRVRRRFLREGRALASLRHPHILAVREVIDGLAPMLVVDLVDGESLQARLERDGPLPAREAAALVGKLALALDYAHQVGVLHRDVKPDNVLLARGEPVLVDFGLAKLTDPSGAHSQVTQEGQFLGTPGYWSPEQAAGRLEPDPRSDVYALGATLYALLTGEPPFVTETIMDALSLVASAAPAPPSSRRPDLPAGLEAICLRCLEKDPAARYPTARALAHDLETLLATPAPPPRPTAPRPPTPRPRSQRGRAVTASAPPGQRRAAIAGTLGGALLVAVAGALVVSRPASDAAGPPSGATATPPPPATEAPPVTGGASVAGGEAILGVRVVDERGAPVDDAAVVVRPVQGEGQDGPTTWQERRTDPDGRALLHAGQARQVEVFAWTERRHGVTGPLALTPGRVTDARLVLDRPAGTGVVRLRVLAGQPPAPFQGTLHYRAGASMGMGRFDGEKVFDRLAAPLTAIAVFGEEVGPACVILKVAPGETTEATLVLPPPAVLAGRLRGGRPAGGGRVHVATALGPWGLVPVASGAVREDGGFDVSGLLPDAAHRVVVTLPGCAPIMVAQEVVASAALPARLEVRLPEAEALVVTVEDETGAPVVGAEVSYEAASARSAWWPSPQPLRTDARGRAAWLGAPLVPEVVEVQAPGFQRALVSDAMGAFVRVRLERAAALGQISGYVCDERGRAMPGVLVRGRTADGVALKPVTTDFAGTFSLPCPLGASAEVTIEGTDTVRVVRHVEAVAAEPVGLRVVLVAGVRVRGRVAGSLGARVESVQALGPSGEEERAVVSDVGGFDLDRLAPGRWVFTAAVRLADGRLGHHRVEVDLAGTSQDVVLTVEHALD